MKVFLSHSSAQKPLVRQLRGYFREPVKTWLDEDELLIGDEIELSLEKAITKESDYVLLFVDAKAVASDWVAKEIRWALAQEKALGRTIVLPVLVEESSWNRLEPEELRDRKFLRLYEETESGIRNLAERITADLVALIDRELTTLQESYAKRGQHVPNGSSSALLAGFMKKMDIIWVTHFDAAGKIVRSIDSDDGLARFYDCLDDFFVTYWRVFDAHINRKLEPAKLASEIETQYSQGLSHAEQVWRDVTRILQMNAKKLMKEKPKRIVSKNLEIYNDAEKILQDTRSSRTTPEEDRLILYNRGAMLLAEFNREVARG